MHILLNGDPISLEENSKLTDLLEKLALENGRIAVELNRQIVSRSHYSSQQLHDGDVIEIVQAIGGG